MADDYFAHRHSAIHLDVSIGKNSRIWQFASVIRGAVLGEECSVGANAIIDGAKLGKRCAIGHAASLHPGIVLGDDVFVGPSAVLCNDMWPSTNKDGWSLEAFQNGFVTIRVGNGAIIGANAVILPGVTIGEGAMVAAGAVCGENVPAGYVFLRHEVLYRFPDRKDRMRPAL